MSDEHKQMRIDGALVRELAELLSANELSEIEVEDGDRKIRVRRELTVAVLADEALCVTELKPVQGFYDYDAKYTDGLTTHVCPADVPANIAQEMMDMALAAHRLLGCKGASRSDFRWDDTQGEAGVYLLEVNTQPGMTPLSCLLAHVVPAQRLRNWRAPAVAPNSAMTVSPATALEPTATSGAKPRHAVWA